MRDKRVLILAFIVLFTFAFINDSFGQNIKSSADYIYVIPVKGVINRGLAAFVTRMIGEAEKAGAKALIFEIDTPGGEVGAAIQMSNAILDTFIPTVSFINNDATSAGVIIAISSKKLVAVPGGTHRCCRNQAE